MPVRASRRRYAVVPALLAVGFGSAAVVGELSRAPSERVGAVPRVAGVARAAPAVNFKHLALKKRREARLLMRGEHDVLPERWQEHQERLERLRAAGHLPRTSARRVRPFRAGSASSPSPALASSFKALDDNGLFVPPDTEGAPGLDKLLVTVNGTVQIQNKSDGSVVSTATLNSFFGAIPNAGIVFDPHVLFDPYAGRWIVVAVSNADSVADLYLVEDYARTRLRAAHCSVGTITRRFSRVVASGRVLSQAVVPGKQLANGAPVKLAVSKGRVVMLCYRHHTLHVTKAVAKKLGRHGASLGACRKS
jgi:hypothetical protein